MSLKSANVMVRVEPEIKEEAEEVLAQLGMPVSVVINALYHQIIYRKGIPFSLYIPSSVPARDTMTDDEFDSMLDEAMKQSQENVGTDLSEAVKMLKAGI